MGEAKKTNGIFLGRVFVMEGTQKTGKKFKKYKCTFKPSEQSTKQFSMSEFVAEGSEPRPLKENTWYNIEYSEDESVYNGSPVTYKTIRHMTEGKGDVTQMTQATQPKPQFDQKSFDAWTESYKGLREGKEVSPVHMLGTYLMNFQTKEYWALYEQCCKALKVEIPK